VRKRRCGKADDEHRQELDTTRERMTHRRATREQLLDRFPPRFEAKASGGCRRRRSAPACGVLDPTTTAARKKRTASLFAEHIDGRN